LHPLPAQKARLGYWLLVIRYCLLLAQAFASWPDSFILEVDMQEELFKIKELLNLDEDFVSYASLPAGASAGNRGLHMGACQGDASPGSSGCGGCPARDEGAGKNIYDPGWICRDQG
jgi:hypothetical protein